MPLAAIVLMDTPVTRARSMISAHRILVRIVEHVVTGLANVLMDIPEIYAKWTTSACWSFASTGRHVATVLAIAIASLH